MSKKESYIETWFKIIISEEFPEINDELLEKYSNIKEKIFSENQKIYRGFVLKCYNGCFRRKEKWNE